MELYDNDDLQLPLDCNCQSKKKQEKSEPLFLKARRVILNAI
jgi:hypothetical protein